MNLRPWLIFLIVVAPPLAAAATGFDAASATNQVGLDLYRQLAGKQPGGNLVISPYSIESGLALADAGADGATRAEMARALHFPEDDAELQLAFAVLRTALDQVASQSARVAALLPRRGDRVDAIEWHAANRLYGQSGYAFREAFLSLMRDGWAAPFEPLDFRTGAEAARGTINAWVEDQTRNKIRDLIPRGGLTPDTRLVLVNALYLKAPWQSPFKKSLTTPQPFHVAGGAPRDTPTMQQTGRFGYAMENGLAVVALSYLDDGLQFLILLPDEGRSVDAVPARLTADDFARWAKLGEYPRRQSVSLHLPKFRIEGATVPLGRALRTLGVRSAFDEPPGSANFERIAPRKPDGYLAISEVFHQTFIALDEDGTEAAAATATTMFTLAAHASPPKSIEVLVDRPFLFAIQHRASGTCLFLGRITDPR